MATLSALQEEAARHLARGEHADALRCCHQILTTAPQHCEARLGVARALLGLRDSSAKDLFVAAARHALRFGAPLSALWCGACLAAEKDVRAAIIAREAATSYAAGSELSTAAQTTPPPQEALPARPIPFFDIVAETKQLALQELAPPSESSRPAVPLLSLFPKPAFAALCLLLRPLELTDGQYAFREGEPGASVFFVVSGKLALSRAGEDKALGVQEAGACVGELALVSAAPRAASAQAKGPTQLLELSRAALQEIARKIPEVEAQLQRFARERLLRNLLATAPIFRPFPKKRRVEMIRHFTGHEVGHETHIITEGQQGKGLYLVLVGSVEVYVGKAQERVSLATLGSGDIFGEMSLITRRPTNASVVARESVQLLFLSRESFWLLVESEPALKDFFQKLSEDRAKALEQMLAVEEISIEEEDISAEEIDVDDSLLV